MLSDYFSHTVNVTRNTDVILASTPLSVNAVLTNTFSEQDVVIEAALTTGTTATVLIKGSLNGSGVTGTLSFTAASPATLITNQHFDSVTGVSSTLGATGSVTVKSVSRMGQKVFSESSIYTSLAVRLDKGSVGSLDLASMGSVISDKVVCFTTAAEATILVGDTITDTSTSNTFQVEDVNVYYDDLTYRYTELVLDKL